MGWNFTSSHNRQHTNRNFPTLSVIIFSYYNEKSKNYNMLPNLIWGRSAKDAHYRHWSIKFNNLNASVFIPHSTKLLDMPMARTLLSTSATSYKSSRAMAEHLDGHWNSCRTFCTKQCRLSEPTSPIHFSRTGTATQRFSRNIKNGKKQVKEQRPLVPYHSINIMSYHIFSHLMSYHTLLNLATYDDFQLIIDSRPLQWRL